MTYPTPAMMKAAKPITIRGVEYRSMRAAALALGVSQSVVHRHARRGTLDQVGMVRKLDPKPGSGRKPVPVLCRGVTYRSIGEAAAAIGVSYGKLYRAIEEGWIDDCRPGRRNAKENTT